MLSDQFKIHESKIDRSRQEAVLDSFCSSFGLLWLPTKGLCEYDAFIYQKGVCVGLAEVKYRNNSFDKYLDYQIDASKIDGLITEANKKGLRSVLIVSWKGDIRFASLSNLPTQSVLFPVSFTKRKDRDELPDRQYHIPLSLFRTIDFHRK